MLLFNANRYFMFRWIPTVFPEAAGAVGMPVTNCTTAFLHAVLRGFLPFL